MGNFKLSSSVDRFGFGAVKSKVSAFFAVSCGRVPFFSVAAKAYTAKTTCVITGNASVPTVNRLANVSKIANPIVINPAVDVIYDVGPVAKLHDPCNSVRKVNPVVDFGVKVSTSILRGKSLLASKAPIPLIRSCSLSVFVTFKRTDWTLFPKKESAIWVVFQYRVQEALRNFRRSHLYFPTFRLSLTDHTNSVRECKHA